MKKVRFGLLGPGNIANTFTKAIKNTPNAELIAVASHNGEKAKAFATTHKIPKFYDSYDQLLKDDEVDAVYISVINTKHIDAIKKCVEYKKPVICEKPIVMTEKDMKYIQSLQKDNDILIMEAMWTNFLPITHKTKQWIENKNVGDLKSIYSSFCFENHDLEGRLYNKQMGGGALFDVGVYTLSYSMYLNNSAVKSQTSKIEYSTTEVDQKGETVLNFKNGVKATCRYSISHNEEQNSLIVGTSGSIEIKDFWRAHKCTLKDNDGKIIEEFFDDTEFGFQYEIEHFANLVLNGEKQSDIMPLSQSIKCSHLFDEILGSK